MGHGNHGRNAGLSPGSARRPQKSLRKGRNLRRLTLSVQWWKVLGQVKEDALGPSQTLWTSCAKANGLCLVWAPTSSERSHSDPDNQKPSLLSSEKSDPASDGETCQSHVRVGDGPTPS